MNPKPSKSGRGRRLLGLSAAGAMAIGLAGAGLATAGPALADPAYSYVVVGSNTTQDALNAFADFLGDGTLASFDAVTPGSDTSYNDGNTNSNVAGDDVEIAPAKVPFGVANSSASQTNCDFLRPNGSGAGLSALEYSINSSFTGAGSSSLPKLTNLPTGVTPNPGPGCIDFSRSSNAPGSNAAAGGDLVYIPWGGDVLAPATGNSTGGTSTEGSVTVTASPTAITNADDLSLTDLETLYQCKATDPGGSGQTVITLPDGDTYGEAGSVSYYVRVASGTAPTYTYTSPPPDEPNDVPIDLTIPQSGSGTRNYWLSVVDPTDTSNATPPCATNTIVSVGSTADNSFLGQTVEENDGLVYSIDPNALGPLSVAQYLAQNNGYGTDRIFTVVVHKLFDTVSGVTTQYAPYTGTPGNGTKNSEAAGTKINTQYPIFRYVYNIIQTGRVISGYTDSNSKTDGTFDPTLAGMIAGPNSQLCDDISLIGHYGFATLPATLENGTSLGCGATSLLAVTNLVP